MIDVNWLMRKGYRVYRVQDTFVLTDTRRIFLKNVHGIEVEHYPADRLVVIKDSYESES